MVGIHLVISTFVGLAIGYMIDKFFGTGPWFTFIFLFLGIVAGFRDLFQMTKAAMNENNSGEPEHPGDYRDDYEDEEDRDDD